MWTAFKAVIPALGMSLAVVGGSTAAAETQCNSASFEDVPYTYCVVDPGRDDLRIWHTAPDGLIYGTFDRLATLLEEEGQTLVVAMNGGMYHEDRAPVGLYIEDGEERVPIATRAGPGNFGLLPNGVFCIEAGRASVIETLTFTEAPPACRFATQSGPMLVIDGALHPRFLEDGTSRYVRNGVGVRRDGSVVFAISDRPVNFHRFARIFRDALDTPNALYIDGNVSRLYAPGLGRHDIGFPVGPIVGTVTQASEGN